MIENKVKENLLNKIIKKIKQEQPNIKKANQIDKKYYNMNISIEKLLEISEELKKQELEENSPKDVLVIHNGNPYVTYIVAIKALINEMNIKICVNETMLGTNLILAKIIQEVEKEMKIQTRIEIERNIGIEAIKEENTNIIVLGDNNRYRRLITENRKNVKFSNKNKISIYVENEDLEKLKQNIIQYGEDNLIEIEVYEAENVEDAMKQIKADNQGEKVMLLTKEKIDKEAIEGIPVTINENILKDFEKELVKEKIL